MANAVQPSFAPVASARLSAIQGSSSRIALPGSGTDIVRVCNYSPLPVGVVLGNGSVVAAPTTSMVIMPGQVAFLTQGANDHIAAIGIGFGTGLLDVTTGN